MPRGGSAPKDCHERALGLLAVRARGRHELERRLLGAGFDPTEVADELTRLEGVGLLDDEAFARQVAEHGFGSRRDGRRAVAGALAAKGVAPSLAAAVLDEVAGDEQLRADELASLRATRLQGLPVDKAAQRLQGFLLRRGYGYEVARQAVRKALDVDRSVG